MFAAFFRLLDACQKYISLHTFGVALTLSILLHGIALETEIGESKPGRRIRDRGLEVVLVNSSSKTKPNKNETQVLAQTNLDGGGNTDQKRRISSPLPPTIDQAGDQMIEMRRRQETLEAQRRELLLANQSASQILRGKRERLTETAPQENGFDMAEALRQMARLEGEIARNTEIYNSRPRKHTIGLRGEEYIFANYAEEWAQKIERWGTLNYPEAARGKLYSSLTLTATIDRKGQIVDVTIDRPSPHKVLNDAARRIVLMAAPYAPFPPIIPANIDQFVITRTITFTQGNQIETSAKR